MINKKKLAELRRWWDNGPGECPVNYRELVDSYEAALAVVDTAKAVQAALHGQALGANHRALFEALLPFSEDICGVKVRTDPTLKPDEWRIDK